MILFLNFVLSDVMKHIKLMLRSRILSLNKAMYYGLAVTGYLLNVRIFLNVRHFEIDKDKRDRVSPKC